jgi:hypothetical protein
MREQGPGATTLGYVEYGIEDLADMVKARANGSVGRR